MQLLQYIEGKYDSATVSLDISHFDLIPPNTSKKYSYLALLDEPGIYLASFKSPIDDKIDKDFILKEFLTHGSTRIYFGSGKPNFLPSGLSDTIVDEKNSERNERQISYWIVTKYIEVL